MRFVSVRIRPLIVSPHFGTESDLEFELVERPACFDCSQLWANYARRQLELEIHISSGRSKDLFRVQLGAESDRDRDATWRLACFDSDRC